MNTELNVRPEKERAFVEEFLQEYLSRGFGSLSKREVDVLVMHLLMKYADLDGMSNFDLSLAFKLSETKVKNLKYESSLKHSKNSASSIEHDFLSLLDKAKLKVIGKETWISLAIEDNFLKSAIKAKVKENGSFTDSSFNSEIVKISAEDFSYLMDEFYDGDEKENIKKEVTKLFLHSKAKRYT